MKRIFLNLLAALTTCGVLGSCLKLPEAPQLVDDTVGVPVLIAPQNQSLGNQRDIIFRWSRAQNAANYLFQIGTNPNPSDTDPTPNEGSDTVRTQTLSTDGAYFWRVRAKSARGTVGTWSTTANFNIDTQGPSAPQPRLPEDGQVFQERMPTLTWDAINEQGIRYGIEVSRNMSFPDNSNLIRRETNTNSHKIENGVNELSDALYFWRVRAKDVAGNTGLWSSTSKFTVDNVAPTALPKLKSPDAGIAITDRTPTFEWDGIAEANVKYDLEVWEDDAFKLSPLPANPTLAQRPIAISSLTTQYVVQPNESLPYEFYSWRVRARDAAGNVGPWTNAWLVRICEELTGNCSNP